MEKLISCKNFWGFEMQCSRCYSIDKIGSFQHYIPSTGLWNTHVEHESPSNL